MYHCNYTSIFPLVLNIPASPLQRFQERVYKCERHSDHSKLVFCRSLECERISFVILGLFAFLIQCDLILASLTHLHVLHPRNSQTNKPLLQLSHISMYSTPGTPRLTHLSCSSHTSPCIASQKPID